MHMLPTYEHRFNKRNQFVCKNALLDVASISHAKCMQINVDSLMQLE